MENTWFWKYVRSISLSIVTIREGLCGLRVEVKVVRNPVSDKSSGNPLWPTASAHPLLSVGRAGPHWAVRLCCREPEHAAVHEPSYMCNEGAGQVAWRSPRGNKHRTASQADSDISPQRQASCKQTQTQCNTVDFMELTTETEARYISNKRATTRVPRQYYF